MPSPDPAPDTRHAPAWLRWIARSGILSEGLIYVLIGGLALDGAFDRSQPTSGSKGAMSRLSHVPLGHELLGLLALGLAAFVLWQVLQAVFDPEYRSDRWKPKRVAVRFHHLWSAVVHLVWVGLAGWQLLQDFSGTGGSGSHGQSQRQLTAEVLRLPGGRWLVAGVGVGIVGFGIVQWVLACRPASDTRMDLSHTPLRRPILVLLVVGYVARGVLFGLVGVLMIHAAWTWDPSSSGGVAGALESIRQQSHGAWLLSGLAAGIIAFGIAHMAKVRYRVIRLG